MGTSEDKAFELSKRLGTGLKKPEIRHVRSYFKSLGREVTEIELQTIGQTWSEHCFHKIFKSQIQVNNSSRVVQGLLKSFIRKSTEEIGADWIFSAFDDNAGIVKFEDNFSIAAKVETHNHPSAVDPFGGAATGVGGVIRDILGVWAQPIANTDALCFAQLDFPYNKLPKGAKHPAYLMKGVVSGIGNYGNNMGIPTVNGAIYFDNSFAGYTLVFCGCIGLLRNKNYAHNASVGDILVIAGSKTGREGLHGVNFASEKLGERTDELRSAVQIPNPLEEEKLRRSIREIADKHLASAITDLGGGGLSSAVCELARKYQCSAEVDLASIPVKSHDISPTELWISETQERMVLAVPEATLAKVLSAFEREEVEATAFGKLVTGNEIILKVRDSEIGRLNLDFLFSPPLPKLKALVPKLSTQKNSQGSVRKLQAIRKQKDYTNDLLSLLSTPNISSKENIVRTYDHEVQGRTVLKPYEYPGGGPLDACVLKPLMNSELGLVLSSAINPSFGKIDPYWMGASMIDEAIRNNVAVGGRRIALLDNFAWGDPEEPSVLGDLLRCGEACYDYSKVYGTPFISGKDSLYNQTGIGNIPPTLLVTAIGIIPDISHCVSSGLKNEGDAIYQIGAVASELGGSEYFRMKGLDGNGTVPRVDSSVAPVLYQAMNRVVDQSLVSACHDISQGGMAVALSEMCFANGLGMEIDAVGKKDIEPYAWLFSESNSRFVAEVKKGKEAEFEKELKGLPFERIGLVSSKSLVEIAYAGKKVVKAKTASCRKAWIDGLSTPP